MDNYLNENGPISNIGIPYDNIEWYDLDGQPFGLASDFNLIVFNDANNIIDVEGAVAIGGSFYSPRGFSAGFIKEERGQARMEYSPDLVKYLVGGNVAMSGPLVVTGHAVVGGGFRAAKGSTYLIGKDGTNGQLEDLKYLYQAPGGSPYWTPSEKEDHFVIPSYDVPRVIRASRIDANLPAFFEAARESILAYKDCIEDLNINGTINETSSEWILRGTDPVQNVFLIDARPNGLINKRIRIDIPDYSIAIIRFRTGNHAHLQSGAYGDRMHANRTLYVFEDATDIHMEVSSDIWGSILAPMATFHAHPTGGHVSGNAALGIFAVNATSGFEFHHYPFVGGVVCEEERIPTPVPAPIPRPMPIMSPAPIEAPAPCPPCPVPLPCPECPPPPPCPAPVPCPECPTCPAPVVCPECPTCPAPIVCPECPTCPAPIVCPECPICPPPIPCPICPTPVPCPECPPCPAPVMCPECPPPVPCPTCPPCPAPLPCPECPTCPKCPTCPECPICPECPEQDTEYVAIPVPIPIPITKECPPCPPCPKCPECEECLITPGIIFGCICKCICCRPHQWDVMLYFVDNCMKTLLYCEQLCGDDHFEFEVPYQGCYLLKICPSRGLRFCCTCKPKVILKNVGVSEFMIEC